MIWLVVGNKLTHNSGCISSTSSGSSDTRGTSGCCYIGGPAIIVGNSGISVSSDTSGTSDANRSSHNGSNTSATRGSNSGSTANMTNSGSSRGRAIALAALVNLEENVRNWDMLPNWKLKF